ncbi:hypothetical protein BAUCODRAFT_193877 [Baudoinia panamericana UAMH 10762]|uniref:HMG box domain-containing protein n=1 Tax=Baudoinia panamericana (strain UAMH 10762) TaxID=717646 RepID=M2MVR2_BAUPA|nr:uncharacterized protein BAUCODRAFT_193877 [Baudoinia panamericana UAMH 10762]EMD01052.1 hypothetical protein BAUCODRAFT_193877 [Baudoinia panamericana UAMH 10762]
MFGRRVAVLLHTRPSANLPVTTPPPCQYELALRPSTKQTVRTYATPSRPRSVVGEPSKTIRRAVKRAAPKATSSDSPAKQKVEAKKESAAAKKKTTSEPNAKPKAKAKATAKPKPKPKKVLTDKQKAAQKVKLEKLKIVELKKAALDPPSHRFNTTAYRAFYADHVAKLMKERRSEEVAQTIRGGAPMKECAGLWREISAADREHWNHIAHTDRESKQAAYKRWVDAHAPEEIDAANKARAQLRRLLPKQKSKWPKLPDERRAKQPLSAFVQFTVNRNASGDFKHIALPERAKLIAEEWRGLSGGEKEKYQSLQKEDAKRYQDEYSSTYGHPPPSFHEHEQPRAAAAAAA